MLRIIGEVGPWSLEPLLSEGETRNIGQQVDFSMLGYWTVKGCRSENASTCFLVFVRFGPHPCHDVMMDLLTP